MIRISEPLMGREEETAVARVLKSGLLAQGKNVELFENKVATYIGQKYGVATSSGTSALQICLRGLGLKEGDEVITTPFSFIASANCIIYAGAKPVFADIDPETFNINPGSVEKKLTEKTKAVLAVHLYGMPCDMMHLREICKDRGLLLIEDCAQALGATYRGKRVGSFGDAACFSFYPTKNITTGEGGMILTSNFDQDATYRILRNQGQESSYVHTAVSYNYRMTEISAAMGLEQMKKLTRFNRIREKNASFLTENLKKIKWLDLPREKEGRESAWHLYTVRVLGGKRDALQKHLAKNDIESKVFYPVPIYLQPAYKSIGFETGLCPSAEKASREVLSLPVHPRLSRSDLNLIVSSVKSFEG